MLGKQQRLPLKNHHLYSNSTFRERIEAIPLRYYEQIPANGNCFYTSYIKSIFPYISSSTAKLKEFLNFTELFEKSNVPWAVYEFYIESIEETLQTNKCISSIENEGKLSLFIGYIRLLIASYIRTNEELFQGFIEHNDIESDVKANIDPMGQRAGEFEISTLSSILNYKIFIYDITINQKEPFVYGTGDEIYILYSHDHFEPLFRKINC